MENIVLRNSSPSSNGLTSGGRPFCAEDGVCVPVTRLSSRSRRSWESNSGGAGDDLTYELGGEHLATGSRRAGTR